jgi:hypothetical protein
MTMAKLRSTVFSGGVLVSLVLLGIAVWSYGVGAEDQRWQLAGLADPFLGHPSPAVSVIAGLVLSAMVATLAALARRNRPPQTRTTRGPRWHWWWMLIAGWGGYIAGSAVMIAGSSPVVSLGAMHVEFGAPLLAVADVPATCRSVVGEPELVAQVVPDVDGFVALDLRTGLGWALLRASLTDDDVPGNDFEPPNVPDRPALYLRYQAADGSTRTGPPISFVRAYRYWVEQSTDADLSGVVRLTGYRFEGLDWSAAPTNAGFRRGWANLTIPNDPWPAAYELTVSWTCAAPAP